MLNIGWTEFVFLVLIFFIFIKPKDIPLVLKKILNFYNKFKNYITDITTEIDQSYYAKEIKRRNKEILSIEKEIKKIKSKDLFNKK
tara:strand:- start:2017 stop:2274 length:258 start_codon:yes stop_codon:yes gene_type:complete